jgi:hypothetical protein
MDRTVDFLLKKYETKQPGEQWNINTELEYLKEYQNKQRMFILEKIINERTTKSRGTFKLHKAQKDRARYLIEHLDFYLGRTTEKQFIVMILVYVKLERNRNGKLNDYLPLLTDYGIDVQTFVRFLIKVSVYHLEN